MIVMLSPGLVLSRVLMRTNASASSSYQSSLHLVITYSFVCIDMLLSAAILRSFVCTECDKDFCRVLGYPSCALLPVYASRCCHPPAFPLHMIGCLILAVTCFALLPSFALASAQSAIEPLSVCLVIAPILFVLSRLLVLTIASASLTCHTSVYLGIAYHVPLSAQSAIGTFAVCLVIARAR